MTRSEYVERVLSVMRYATPSEREAIRAEIDAHIEDHICDLMELDYDEALAEERTMARMGDPEEVGRELDKQYTNAFWLWLEGAARILLALSILVALTGFGVLFHFRDSMVARIAPDWKLSPDYHAAIQEETDYRMRIGNDIVRVFYVSIMERRMSNAENTGVERRTVAEVLVCTYDRIPGGIVSGDLLLRMKVADQRGIEIDDWGRSSGSWGAAYERFFIPIEPGDTYVTLSYDRFGESVTLKVPLPEVIP